MNKSYRTIWNHARQCLMVVGENVTPQGKARSARTAVAQAVTAALLALGAGQAFAVVNPTCGTLNADTTIGDPSFNSGNSVTGPCTLGTNVDLTVQATKSISGNTGILVHSGTSAGSITNGGLINATGIAVWITAGSTVSAINNLSSGTISGGGSVLGAWDHSTVTGGIVNSGWIRGLGAAGYMVSIGSTATVVGGITNSGRITAATGYGRGVAVYDHSLIVGDILNTASGTVGGTIAGGGAYINAAGIYIESSSSVSGGIINSSLSTISGYDGISVSGSTIGGDIQNGGLVTGVNTAIRASQSVLSGRIGNSATGTISGGVFGISLENADLGQGLTNAGTITGINAINLMSGSAVAGGITNSGTASVIDGSASGIYLIGGGTVSQGILNQGSISGAIYGGIWVDNSTLSGGIANSGTASSIYGYADGIQVYGGTVSGGISNQGVVAGSTMSGVALNNTTLSGGISNDGTSSAIAGAQYGVQADHSWLTGNIVNQGIIRGVAADGVRLYDDSLTGGLTNSGTGSVIVGAVNGLLVSASSMTGGILNAGAISNTNAGSGNGVYVHSATVSGGIINAGDNSTISGGSVGVYLQAGVVSAGFDNQGVIKADAWTGLALYSGSSISGGVTNSGLVYGASGMHLNGSRSSGGISNSGTILGNASMAVLVGAGSSVAGGLVNSNLISGNAAGIAIDNSTLTEGLTNSGSISASNALKLASGGLLTGGVTNSGASSAISGSDSGIWLTGNATLADGILNQGSITGAAWGGIWVDASTITGGITNSGTASLLSGGKQGLHANNSQLSGGIANAGTISGGTESGIYLGQSTLSGRINNASGATISGVASGEHAGVWLQSAALVSGDITNSGLIKGSYGIYVDSSYISGDIVNTVSGVIDGQSVDGIAMLMQSTLGGSIFNSGMIRGAERGVRVDASTISGGITNSGTADITGGDTGIQIAGGSMISGGIHNAGTVTGTDIVGLTIGFGSLVENGVSNQGTISGGQVGLTVLTSALLQGGITNSGESSLISGGNEGLLLANSVVADGLVNQGKITGQVRGLVIHEGATLSGIDNQGLIANTAGTSSSGYAAINIYSGGNITAGITNSGTISALGYAGILAWGDGISAGGTISGGITNSGTQSRLEGKFTGIALTHSSVTGGIHNAGVISGASNAGISVYSSSLISGGITNSGLIYGGVDAMFVEDGSTATGGILNQTDGHLLGGLYLGSGVGLVNNGIITLEKNVSDPASLTAAGGIYNTGTATNGTIGGDYTQGSGGTLRIAAAGTASGEYSRLIVGGNASVAGIVDVDVKTINTLIVGNTLAGVVSAAGSLSGTFSDVTDNSALFNFESVVNGSGIDLAVLKALTNVQAVTTSGNRPARGAAGALDRIIDSGDISDDMQEIIDILGSYETEQEVSDAISRLLPLMTGSQVQSLLSTLHGLGYLIQSQNGSNYSVSSGDGTMADRRFWFKPFGSWANQDERDSVSGFDADSYGMVFGADTTVSERSRVGGAFSYVRTEVDSDSNVAPNNADIDSYMLAVYGSHALNAGAEFTFQADYGFHNTEGKRSLLLPGQHARSDYDSWSAHVGAGLAHTLGLSEKTSITPSVRADYTRLETDSYREKGGGGANLHVGETTTEELILSVDAKLAHALSDKATFTASLGAGYDVINDESRVTSSFAGAPGVTFSTRGLDPSPWMVRGGLGIVGNVTESLEVTARYDAEVREDFDNQSASIKLRWAF